MEGFFSLTQHPAIRRSAHGITVEKCQALASYDGQICTCHHQITSTFPQERLTFLALSKKGTVAHNRSESMSARGWEPGDEACLPVQEQQTTGSGCDSSWLEFTAGWTMTIFINWTSAYPPCPKPFIFPPNDSQLCSESCAVSTWKCWMALIIVQQNIACLLRK